METINITVKLPEHQVVKFQQFIEEHCEHLVDFKILPDTQKMWEEDEGFKSITKNIERWKKTRDKYINDNNNKYKIK